jgi:hypothetical protein
MPISIAERLAAMLDTINASHLDTLPPARLRQLAVSMRHWAAIADQSAERRGQRQQGGGVLGELRRRQGQE